MRGRFRRKTNHDWWDKLDQAARKHRVKWEWTRGHSGHVIQEATDRAARKIAAQGRVDDEVLRDAIDRVGDVDPLQVENE